MLASITGQIVDGVGRDGVYAVFLLMAIDAVLPAGGEIVMLYAGVLASGSVAHEPSLFGAGLGSGLGAYVVLALAGTLGYLVGSLAGWALGRRGGAELLARHGHWLHLGPARVRRAERWFARFGGRAVFIGRLTPLVRSFISIPAGVLGIHARPYTWLTLLGSLIWCFAFAGAGWALGGNYESVHHAFRYVDYAVIAAFAALLATVLARRVLRRA